MKKQNDEILIVLNSQYSNSAFKSEVEYKISNFLTWFSQLPGCGIDELTVC